MCPMAIDADAIQPGTCPNCGFPGPHSKWSQCVSVLRDRIAILEFQRGGQPRPGRPALRTVSPSGRLRAHDIPRFVAG
jgi:hypothetical protein